MKTDEITSTPTIIESGKAEKNYWQDLYRYRELFYILAWRDLKVRYKQTYIGIAWALLRPLITMLIFTIIFSKVAQMHTEGSAPYVIFVFSAMLPWQLISSGLTDASDSLINHSQLLTKVYFPRLILPVSSVITSLVDFLISLVLLLFLMAYYQYPPHWKILFLPIFFALAIVTALAFGIYLSALNIKYRDFRYIIPFIVQLGLYISPVGYSSNIIPERWKFLYYANPVAGIIDGFRWCIIPDTKTTVFNWYSVLSFLVVIFFLVIGIRQFRRIENTLSDFI